MSLDLVDVFHITKLEAAPYYIEQLSNQTAVFKAGKKPVAFSLHHMQKLCMENKKNKTATTSPKENEQDKTLT